MPDARERITPAEQKARRTALQKKWKEDNREWVTTYHKDYEEKNRDRRNVRRKARRNADKGKSRDGYREYRANNNEDLNAYQRERRAADLDGNAAYHRKYRRDHSGRVNANQRERRAAKKAIAWDTADTISELGSGQYRIEPFTPQWDALNRSKPRPFSRILTALKARAPMLNISASGAVLKLRRAVSKLRSGRLNGKK